MLILTFTFYPFQRYVKLQVIRSIFWSFNILDHKSKNKQNFKKFFKLRTISIYLLIFEGIVHGDWTDYITKIVFPHK